MDIDGLFVLPTDALLTSGANLSERMRQRIGCRVDDFLISRPRSRSHVQLVNAEAADLLREFRSPKRIIEAIIEHGGRRGAEPERVLEDSFPLLQQLINCGILSPADAETAAAIRPLVLPGQQVAGLDVLETVQVLDDSEVHRVSLASGQDAALKLARLDSPNVLRLFTREAKVLKALGGRIGPRLLEAGEYEGHPYLVLEWIAGIDALSYVAAFRTAPLHRANLRDLYAAILEAYSRLHELDVLHGDVHAKNVLCTEDGGVRLIDFGYSAGAAVDEPADSIPRGGVNPFFEPEFAAARLRGERPPAISTASEVYAVGALLYLLATGEHYCDFSVERDVAYRQIVEAAPLPFCARGMHRWPELENALFKALEKSPGDRYQTMAQFAERVQGARCDAGRITTDGSSPTSPRLASAIAFLDDKLDAFVGAGHLASIGLRKPPRCSAHGGEAGIAYFLYRVACAREDADLLASADLCANRAVEQRHHPDAFHCDEVRLSLKDFGDRSFYHTVPGPYFVQAMVSRALGDFQSVQEAVRELAKCCSAPVHDVDLMLGSAGQLLGCALLLEALDQGSSHFSVDALRTAGAALCEGITNRLVVGGTIREGAAPEYLGVAHGWAGALYSVLKWYGVTGKAPPTKIASRLRELGELGEGTEKGIQWPDRASHCGGDRRHFDASWCHGTSGYVHLWLLAHRQLSDSMFLALAEGAARHVCSTELAVPQLCCGKTGHAYAMLAMYKHTGEEKWLARAYELGERAVADIRSADCSVNGLYVGELGIALLCSDLLQPERAAMPLFEGEGWPVFRREGQPAQ